MTTSRINLGILFGGASAEHEISVLTAREVIAVLDPARYHVIPIYVSQQGQWHQLDSIDALNLADLDLPQRTLPELGKNELIMKPHADMIPLPDPTTVDVVFPLIHGPNGEDGTVQGLLELTQMAYVGSGVLSSAVAMDKAFSKNIFAQSGLPITPFEVCTRSQWAAEPGSVQQRCEVTCAYPCFVKPANLGSSVGISKVKTPDQFAAAMKEAFHYGDRVVIEKGVDNAREIEVGILGNDRIKASVPGEIIPSPRSEFYDYQAKYEFDDTQLLIPADLPEGLTRTLQEYAMQAYRALNCAGMGRADFLVRRDDDAVFLSEMNTIPGFTRYSMYPKLWEASGISYPDLIDQLVALALG